MPVEQARGSHCAQVPESWGTVLSSRLPDVWLRTLPQAHSAAARTEGPGLGRLFTAFEKAAQHVHLLPAKAMACSSVSSAFPASAGPISHQPFPVPSLQMEGLRPSPFR